jgi:hypothetical protein
MLHSMLRQSETPEERERSTGVLTWIGEHIQSVNRVATESQQRLLDVVWSHFQQHDYAPSRSAVEQLSRNINAPQNMLLVLEEYDRFAPTLGVAQPLDMATLLKARAADWARVEVSEVLTRAMAITNGSVQVKPKGPAMAGPSDAINYLIDEVREKRLTAGVNLGRTGPQGELSEHADDIEQALFARLESPFTGRIMTGFQPIDSKLSIGPGESIRFVGIVGGSNQGKSALLLPWVYTMAKQGKNVCLVPREYSVADAWARLVWIHASHFPQIQLPSMNTWMLEPHRVTNQQKEWVRELIDDLRNKRTIKGCIDVVSCSTFEEIVEHLEKTDEMRNWDCLAVDYIGHLDVKGRAGEAIDEKKRVFRAAQNLALDWRGGRGLLVVTPMQANKTSVEKASEKEGREYGSFEGNLGAVEYFTSAAQDADLLISVFQGTDFRKEGIIKVTCMKSRGAYFEPFLIKVDEVTRHARLHASGDAAFVEQARIVGGEAPPSSSRKSGGGYQSYAEETETVREKVF